MRIIKLYRKPNEPEYFHLVRASADSILVNYPLDKPYRKRQAKWLHLNTIYIDWVKEFKDEKA